MAFNFIYIVPVASAVALYFAWYFIQYILKQNTGTKKMQAVSDAIKEGSHAYLMRQYKTISIIAVVFAIILAVVIKPLDHGIKTAAGFILGALCSNLAGYISMYISVRANLRTASAVRTSLDRAVKIALRGGAVMGLSVVVMSLVGITALYYVFGGNVEQIVGFAFGASFAALFAQLGGGIYTKAADMSADLVGKVEKGIPEDDPRNPAVIADLVGDNVGDIAGRGADLFESITGENIGAMILGLAMYPVFGINGVIFPLVARAAGLFATVAGVYAVSVRGRQTAINALTRGLIVTVVLAGIIFFGLTQLMLNGSINLFFAALVGLGTSVLIALITQYYTSSSFRPVKEIGEASKTGAATNVVAGLSVGLETTGAYIVAIVAALMLSFWLGTLNGGGIVAGIYGTAIATIGMLSITPMILALDGFGPITDNAGGIIEMSGERFSAKVHRDAAELDAVGNTTKALTKGYAIGSAALAAFLLFSAYLAVTKLKSIDIAKPEVFSGAFLGGMIVFLFSALAIRAVGKTATKMIEEVRRQFKHIPGIMRGTAKPDYAAVVDISTQAALKNMILPSLLVVATPIIVGLVLRAEALGALVMVGTIVGVLLATLMNTGGGAMDNAKKYIEAGAFGGKGSDAHKAAVVGDTVGDPLKDTAGPSLHVLIKLLNTITLALAALFI